MSFYTPIFSKFVIVVINNYLSPQIEHTEKLRCKSIKYIPPVNPHVTYTNNLKSKLIHWRVIRKEKGL